MLYKQRFEETIERYRAFWNGEMEREILLSVEVLPCYPPRVPDPQTLAPDIKRMLSDSYIPRFECRRSVVDDSFPAVRVDFGSGLKGALLGGELKFVGGTGFCVPFLEKREKLENLEDVKFSEDYHWAQVTREATEHYIEEGEGKFAVGRTNIGGPTEVAFIIRGNRFFKDYYTDAPRVHKFLDLLTECIIDIQEWQFRIVPNYYGGFFEWFKFIWFPGKAVYLSTDSISHFPPRFFQEFELPRFQKLIDYFGSGWAHVSTTALHLIQDLTKLKDLIGVQIASDPEFVVNFKLLRKMKGQLKDLPMIFGGSRLLEHQIPAAEFMATMKRHEVVGGILYQDVIANSVEEANRLWEMARNYRD